MKDIIETAIIITTISIISCIVSNATEITGELPPGTEKVLQDIQETMYPPWVHDVILDPDPPQAEVPTVVTAHIYNDPSKTSDETFDATLMFTADLGDNWEYIDMEQVMEGRIWSATLPAFKAGTEILYGFSARDSSGNVYTDTPCLVTEWPPENDPCMFDLAIDEPPVDDEEQVIPDNFDFMSFRGGVDEDNLYLELSVQGDISDGTVSPVFVHLYGFGVANVDKGDPSDIITQGFLGFWAPQAESFSYPACSIIHQPSNDVIIEGRNIECETSGGTVWFKISNDQIGDTPSGHLKIIAADGAITSITPFTGIFYDYTHVSSIALFDRSFVVK